PGSHHLVLRDVPPGPRGRLSALPPHLRLPVQLVLQRRRPARAALPAGAALAPHRRAGVPLPRLRRWADARAARAPVRRNRSARPAGNQPRAAAPGAAPDRPEARLLVQPAPPRLSRTEGPSPGDPSPPSLSRSGPGVEALRRRPGVDRPRGRRL